MQIRKLGNLIKRKRKYHRRDNFDTFYLQKRSKKEHKNERWAMAHLDLPSDSPYFHGYSL
ncbi:MAG TPA: hypothetical protein DHW85_04170 [Lachnospiraceae bacterium]|jgi:hypothetical protein|nr:hypothetical protein [Lachnospiraceae bacterium]HCR40393.1 hypothetical protein [Lachnospiraceae bacterium]